MPVIGHQPPPPLPSGEMRHDIAKTNRNGYYRSLRANLLAIRIPLPGDPVEELDRYRQDIVECMKRARDLHSPLIDRIELKPVGMSREMRNLVQQKRIVEHAISNTYNPMLFEDLNALDKQFNDARTYHNFCRDVRNLREAEALSARQKYHEAWERLRSGLTRTERNRTQDRSAYPTEVS